MTKRKVEEFVEENKNEGIIYSHKGNMYMDIPKGMKVKKFVYDDFQSVYVGELKKNSWFLPILLFVALCGLCYVYFTREPEVEYISYQKQIYVQDGVVSFNISSNIENLYPVVFGLYDGDKRVSDLYRLQPGESVGNLNVGNMGLSVGSHPMTLRIIVNKGSRSTSESYDVVVIVEG